MSDTVQFWLLLALVNSYYFIPRYLLDIFHSDFIPIRGLLQGTIRQKVQFLFARKNYDLFRISVDLCVLVLLYPLFLQKSVSGISYAIFLGLYFWFSLLYQVYYHLFHKIYHLDPVFFHDFLMLKTAARIFIYDYGRKNILMTVGAAVIAFSGAGILYYLISLSSDVVFGSGSYGLIALLIAGSLAAAIVTATTPR